MITKYTCLVLFFWFGVSSTQAQNLTHFYDFNGTMVVDEIGGVGGILSGGAYLHEGELILNGSDACVKMSGKIIPLNGVPFSLYIRFSAEPQSDFIAEMISQGYSGGPGFFLGKVGNAWRVTDAYAWGEAQAAFQTGRHDALLTSDHTGTRLLIDGTLVFSSPTPLNIGDNGSGNNTIIGRQFDPYAEWFKGSVDELKIFGGAVSYQQAVAARPNGGDEENTFVYDALGRLTGVESKRSSIKGYSRKYYHDKANNRTTVNTLVNQK